MALVNAKNEFGREDEEKLYEALDKGIDDMEVGKTIPHEEAMAMIKEKVQSYGV